MLFRKFIFFTTNPLKSKPSQINLFEYPPLVPFLIIFFVKKNHAKFTKDWIFNIFNYFFSLGSTDSTSEPKPSCASGINRAADQLHFKVFFLTDSKHSEAVGFGPFHNGTPRVNITLSPVEQLVLDQNFLNLQHSIV